MIGRMIERRVRRVVEQRLDHVPAVVLTGPRQAGKTTLALEVADARDALYLDLESPADRRPLADAESFLAEQEGRLVVLDEVHRAPGLFESLRGLIDRGRRRGIGSNRFLLLGSASIDLLRQSGESLAGRVSYIDLDPVDVLEVGSEMHQDLWTRGGFPESLLAVDEETSYQWRAGLITTYLGRDIPEFGPTVPIETMRRFWTMLAHQQGALFNAAQLARNLGIDGKTATRYVDLMTDLLLVRQVRPWHSNTGKRLVKASKVYVRDSGLLHALLEITDRRGLLAHPIVGASWEGHVIENVLRVAGGAALPSFYRSHGGAEVDLVLEWRNGEKWVIEVKVGLTPKVQRGFHQAVDDIEPDRAYVAFSGEWQFSLGNGVRAIGVSDLCAEVADRARA